MESADVDAVVDGLLLWNNSGLTLEKPTGGTEFKRCGCQPFGRQGIMRNVGSVIYLSQTLSMKTWDGVLLSRRLEVYDNASYADYDLCHFRAPFGLQVIWLLK